MRVSLQKSRISTKLYNSCNLGKIRKIIRQKQSCPAQHTQFMAISFCRPLHKEAICPTRYWLRVYCPSIYAEIWVKGTKNRTNANKNSTFQFGCCHRLTVHLDPIFDLGEVLVFVFLNKERLLL